MLSQVGGEIRIDEKMVLVKLVIIIKWPYLHYRQKYDLNTFTDLND